MSQLDETVRGTKDALQTACGVSIFHSKDQVGLILHHTLQFMPTEYVEEDIQNLGEQACEVLIHMQLPKLSERFTSQTQTLSSLLSLVRNAAMFAEDCSKPEFRGMWYAVFCARNYF